MFYFEYPYYEISGDTYFDVGVCYGKQAKEKIRLAIESYKKSFAKNYPNRSWEFFGEYAMGYIPSIEEYGPELMEQIRGIAEGSGESLVDIMILNTR